MQIYLGNNIKHSHAMQITSETIAETHQSKIWLQNKNYIQYGKY